MRQPLRRCLHFYTEREVVGVRVHFQVIYTEIRLAQRIALVAEKLQLVKRGFRSRILGQFSFNIDKSED